MASTDSRVEIGRLLADSQNQRDATLHTLDSLIAQRASYIEKWHSDATTDLVTVKNDLDTTQGSLTKAAKLNELTSLDAPADAIVLQIAKASRGSIADTSTSTTDPNSDALFTLVPVDVPLEVEMHIASEDVGFVEKGQTVRIKFDAYSYVRHGMATGTVKNLSEGSFTLDPDVGNTPVPAYFKARIALNDVKLHDVPADFRLIPGMTISADIIAGHRTILSYLVEGTLRTGSEAMREPE
jgi:HlyD family type I secretion membrane fusion protein